jgi:hypothetical protein
MFWRSFSDRYWSVGIAIIKQNYRNSRGNYRFCYELFQCRVSVLRFVCLRLDTDSKQDRLLCEI